MSEAARKVATYEDVLNTPPDLIAEIIDGELYTHPRPGPQHTTSASMIGGQLFPYNRRSGGPRGPGGWRILDEPELHLDSQIVVPDLAGWRRERMPALPDRAFFTLAPDWVCEVISPSTALNDRSCKKRIYARHRVQYLWLVDPALRLLEVLQLVGDFWQEVASFSGNVRVRAMPFEELELELAVWWDEEEPAGE